VLAWAGWQWWHQATISTSYRLAQEAVSRKDWDDAYAHYLTASGYRDAEVRAAELGKLISERDRRYSGAFTYSQQGEWFAAFQELNELERIQPGYSDRAGLREHVEQGARDLALRGIGGTVTTVNGHSSGQQPGLHYLSQSGGGWTWLESSDLWSRVQDVYPGGPVIYDVPGPDSLPPPSLASGLGWTSDEEYRLWREQRRFMVMWVKDGRPRFDPVTHNPGDSYFMAGPNGVWHVGLSSRTRNEAQVELITSFPRLAYQPLGKPGADTISLPGPDWTVVDSLSKSGRILLAELHPSGQVTGTNRIYIAGPDGSDRRLAHTFQGDLRNAQLSPNGRYVLLTIFETHDDLTGSQIVLLVDSQDGSSRALARKELSTIWSGQPATQFVGAAFIDKGPFTGKVVAGEWGWDGKLAIFDPAEPTAEPLRVPIEGDVGCCRPIMLVWSGEGVEAGSVSLMGAGPSGEVMTRTNSLTVVKLVDESLPERMGKLSADTARFEIIDVPLDENDEVSPALVRDDYLVYWVWKSSTRGVYSIRSIPLSKLGKAEARPLEIFSGSFPWPPLSTSYSQAPALGSSTLVYMKDGELRARTYDGTLDFFLESDVLGLYGPNPESCCMLR
jgi:hypothetical protein